MTCPEPVYAADTMPTELRTAELLLVVTLRLYAQSGRDPHGFHPDWREGFRVTGILGGAGPAFKALLGIVTVSPRRRLDIGALRCASLGAHEARLLHLVSLLQGGRPIDARAVLADWLPPSAMRLSMLSAQALASSMALGGLVVPLRHTEAAIPHYGARHADRGLVLVQ